MEEKKYPVFFVDTRDGTDSLTGSFANYGSDEFKRKVRWKLSLLGTVLEYGFSLLYIDSDLILLKNPFPAMTMYQNYDFVALRDESICTGFLYMRPTQQSVGLMKYACSLVNTMNLDDQDILNTATSRYYSHWALLPSAYFPSGSNFFNRYQYYWDRTGGRGEAV